MLTAGKVATGALDTTAGIFSEAVITTFDGEGVLVMGAVAAVGIIWGVTGAPA